MFRNRTQAQSNVDFDSFPYVETPDKLSDFAPIKYVYYGSEENLQRGKIILVSNNKKIILGNKLEISNDAKNQIESMVKENFLGGHITFLAGAHKIYTFKDGSNVHAEYREKKGLLDLYAGAAGRTIVFLYIP